MSHAPTLGMFVASFLALAACSPTKAPRDAQSSAADTSEPDANGGSTADASGGTDTLLADTAPDAAPDATPDAETSGEVESWSPPQCSTAATVGLSCTPKGMPCLPGTKGVCTCEGCVCKKSKASKTSCPGQDGCECLQHWECDSGFCVPFATPEYPYRRRCSSKCFGYCDEGWIGLPATCTQVHDACGDKHFICLPEGVTQGDLGVGAG